MSADRPITPITEKHKKSWKTNTWDFLGGDRVWDEALKRFNAAKKLERKTALTKEEEARKLIEETPGGTPEE
jgi:hypothetical protein